MKHIKDHLAASVVIFAFLVVMMAALAYINGRRHRSTFVDWGALDAAGKAIMCSGANADPAHCGNPSTLCVGPAENSWCLKPNANGQWLDLSRNGVTADNADSPTYHFTEDGNMWLNRATMHEGQPALGGWVADHIGQLQTDVVSLKSSVGTLKGAADHPGSASDINLEGKMFFKDSSFNTAPDGTNNSDPYYLEKVIAGNNNSSLRLSIKDDPDESLQIWGNSCAAGDCGGEGMKSHHFRGDGATAHRGSVVAGHPDTTLDMGWGFNFGLMSFNPVVNAWTHFPWKDGRNYIRGPLQVDGSDATINGKFVVNKGDGDWNWLHVVGNHGDTAYLGSDGTNRGIWADGARDFTIYNQGHPGLTVKQDGTVKADQSLCIGNTCVNEAQLKTLLQVSGSSIGTSAQEQSLLSSANTSMNGSSAATAAPSAKYIMSTFGVTSDGAYWINLPQVGPKLVYCIMNPACDGGGWMLAMKGDQGSTFGFHSPHWTTATTVNPNDATRNNGDAKFDVFNVFPASDWMAVFPDVQSGGDVLGGYGGWTWVEPNAVGSPMPPTAFFKTNEQITKLSNGVGYPKTTPTPTSSPKFSSSIWSTQSGFQWYGINYDTVQQNVGVSSWVGKQWNPVRWGFAWNNEANQGSNDVSGGIGLFGNGGGNWSAGDHVDCCQSSSGVMRPMRFEWYVR
ncbi:MAG: hypothetical protein B7Z66_15015 [Chromatiales bacterium 21-64-14]|nr:MAG: hypothetical protein B7Z66_15015 [Chromatiales bacterium 21-64-14]